MTWIPGVAHIERLGPDSGDARLLIEVPHGADQRAHFDALFAEMRGQLPARLHRWFHVNTDIGAHAYGRAAAVAFAEATGHAALVVRCLLPRTLIDVNRVLTLEPGKLGEGGVTPGLPPYVRDSEDKVMLVGRYNQYLRAVEACYDEVCGAGGLAVLAHTYAPRSVSIGAVDDQIVDKLEAVYQPGTIETQPLRHEVDLLTETPEGEDLSCVGLAGGVQAGLVELGYQVVRNGTYRLVPQSMGAVWAARYRGRTLCMEVRRDLVCAPWIPFEQQAIDTAAVEAIGGVVARAAAASL